MIKSFKELYEVDVPITKKPTFKKNKNTGKYEQVGDVDTLNWADCLKCLYDNGAEKVTFEHIPNDKGELVFVDQNNAISIKLFVEIDGDRREIIYPVIDGSKTVAISEITALDIHVAKMRGFVKAVALNWGLGLRLWQKNENCDEVKTEKEELSIAEQFRYLVNTATKKCGGVNEMLKHLTGINEKKIKDLIEDAKTIDGIIKVLSKVLENDNKQ